MSKRSRWLLPVLLSMLFVYEAVARLLGRADDGSGRLARAAGKISAYVLSWQRSTVESAA
ncbi:MAG: hypothetical protein QOE61_1590 [Micromonosporaceae bacterium]|jgi:hypothetical protein|nr:hypothetical protein [Micromonosporaceae bacterium]